MGSFIESSEIILLFDSYSIDSQNLHKSFRMSGLNYPAVVIEDGGFLPEDVTSVYGYFLGDFGREGGLPGEPRYFNRITVPDYWEISGNNSGGSIQNLNRQRGKIFYEEPLHRRLVKVVDWYDERGIVRSSDHYNRYGALYARTIFNAKGHKVNKAYFSAAGRETIVENFVTGDILLNAGDEVRIFRSKTEFVIYFLECAGYRQSRMFFNSLSTPFFVSQQLGGEKKQDVLFWQEPVGSEIPGNMKIILNGQSSRTAKVMVQKKRAFHRLLELGAPDTMVHRLGFIYPFQRENANRPEALICTNSDRLEQCRLLVKALPQLHFHIAALTEMSSKLMSIGTYDNVSLYPGVKQSILDELFGKCDFYLDINHGGEIVSAVRRAFLCNQLIFAFQETLHNSDYVAEEHIYLSGDADRMIADIKAVVDDSEAAALHLELQHGAALAETEGAYAGL